MGVVKMERRYRSDPGINIGTSIPFAMLSTAAFAMGSRPAPVITRVVPECFTGTVEGGQYGPGMRIEWSCAAKARNHHYQVQGKAMVGNRPAWQDLARNHPLAQPFFDHHGTLSSGKYRRALPYNTTFRYRVRVVKASGRGSAWSREIEGRTPLPPPPTPPLIISRDGHPEATIVIGRKVTRAAKFAAYELQWHLEQITGGKFAIAHEDEEIAEGVRILVGESQATRDLGVVTEALGCQEYVIRFASGTLALVAMRISLTSVMTPYSFRVI